MYLALNEEQALIQDTARRFATSELAPVAARLEAPEARPQYLAGLKQLAELGFMGLNVAPEYGGTGAGVVAFSVALTEIARACASTAVAMSVNNMVCEVIQSIGNEAQKRRFIPRVCAGESPCASFCLSESGAGSDPSRMATRAVRDGAEWVLNGTKMWITNGPEASTLVVYAKTDPSAGPRGITAFIIERGFKGFSTAQKLDKLGMRGSQTCELVFQDCEVPAENVLGQEGKGVRVLMSGLDYERAVLAAGPLGIMQACMDVVVPYVHERKQFDRPIGEFQLIQGKLADMYTTMNAAKAYVYAVGKACSRGQATRKDAAGAILFAAEKATWMALEAIQVLGGNGYINDYPTGRLLRDAKLYEIGAGTSEIRRMLIGREIFEQTV